MSERRRKTIREWRAYKKWSKAETAKRLGVNPMTYAKFEDEPYKIRLGDAVKLAKVFGCNLSEIIFFEDNPNIKFEDVV